MKTYSMPPTLSTIYPSDKIQKLLNEKKSGKEFQERKRNDWDENYELYRNKVKTNRLTQRQAVNIPLMKETINTILAKIDDAPNVKWKEKSGDDMKEVIYQAIWDEDYKYNKIDLTDILDKKNLLLYGLSTKKLNITSKNICIDVLDIYDVLYDPLMNALDVQTARFIVQQNIFKTLREILADDRYSTEGKDSLKQWLATDKGIVQSGKNKKEWERALERMRVMGLDHEKFKYFAGGDVIVNLTEHYTQIWNEKKKQFERHVITYADDCIELLDEKLVDLIGIDKWPFVRLVQDPETNDVYPDGVADLVRTPNKIINIWFSQQVENRTLQNFQMHWYDSTLQGYTAQTYEPGPGRMLPAPGDPNKTIMPVQINGLDETFNAINFLTGIVERGTGATALEKGVPENGNQTLGEVQILVGKANERAKTLSKFYHQSWRDTCVLWDELRQSNRFDKTTLYKTGPDGKIYDKVIYDSDWKSKAGYEPEVQSSSEQESDDLKSIQKFSFVQQQFPENQALRRIIQTRQLKLLDLSPAELKEVEDEQKKIQETAMAQASIPQQQSNQTQATQPTQAQQQQQPQDLSNELAQLGQLVGA